MKKLALLLTTVVLVGCAAPTPIAQPEPTSVPNKTFYWLAASINHPFYVPGIEGWNAAAADLGVDAKFVGPQESVLTDQVKVFEELIANPSTGGILIYAMDNNAFEPLYKEAQANGVVVITGNSDSPYKTRDGFIGTANSIMGQQAAMFAAGAIECQGPVGVIANAGSGVIERAEAFRAEIANLCPGIAVEEVGVFDGNLEPGLALVDSYMIAHPDLTLLWWSEGSASAMVGPWTEKRDAGLQTLFLGTDMPDAGLEAIRDSVWIGTIGQDTFSEEYWGLQFLVAKSNGLPIPDSTLLSTIVVTKDNVDQYLSE